MRRMYFYTRKNGERDAKTSPKRIGEKIMHTTKQTRQRLAQLAWDYNVSRYSNGYATTCVYARWADNYDVECYLRESGNIRIGCDYIVLDTICVNEYGNSYSNDLWAVVPINELPERMARQIVNALNNEVHYFDL